jgi:hypothetical protein
VPLVLGPFKDSGMERTVNFTDAFLRVQTLEGGAYLTSSFEVRWTLVFCAQDSGTIAFRELPYPWGSSTEQLTDI